MVERKAAKEANRQASHQERKEQVRMVHVTTVANKGTMLAIAGHPNVSRKWLRKERLQMARPPQRHQKVMEAKAEECQLGHLPTLNIALVSGG